MKPNVYRKVVSDREVESYASLDPIEGDKSSPPLKRYHFYAAMVAHATLSRTHAVLTDYTLYSKLIPYINQAKYDTSTRQLQLAGGIWKWMLSSVIRFDERSDRWIHYHIVSGHFVGLDGDIFFEPMADGSGTLVYMSGEQKGSHWPPAFIIERGAEIVFEFTATRMRSYLEHPEEHDDQDGQKQVPRPRSHL